MTSSAEEVTAFEPPLSSGEVANMLGVSINFVKRMPASELPYFRINSRGDRRYAPEDVRKWIQRRIVK